MPPVVLMGNEELGFDSGKEACMQNNTTGNRHVSYPLSEEGQYSHEIIYDKIAKKGSENAEQCIQFKKLYFFVVFIKVH